MTLLKYEGHKATHRQKFAYSSTSPKEYISAKNCGKFWIMFLRTLRLFRLVPFSYLIKQIFVIRNTTNAKSSHIYIFKKFFFTISKLGQVSIERYEIFHYILTKRSINNGFPWKFITCMLRFLRRYMINPLYNIKQVLVVKTRCSTSIFCGQTCNG